MNEITMNCQDESGLDHPASRGGSKRLRARLGLPHTRLKRSPVTALRAGVHFQLRISTNGGRWLNHRRETCMPNFELIKTVEATKLNKRTGIPTTGPPVTISFGAVIEDLEEDRSYIKFVYLGERYRASADILRPSLREHRPLDEQAPVPGEPGASAESTTSAGASADPNPALGIENQKPQLQWEKLGTNALLTLRSKVPGGWLVAIGEGTGRALAFYPDERHKWDGSSLP
jgi:hypothetical protein